MKMEGDLKLTYALTEDDARRLKHLSLTLSRAIAELLEARCQEAFEQPATECPVDYDLHELSVYEQAHDLLRTHSAENEY